MSTYKISHRLALLRALLSLTLLFASASIFAQQETVLHSFNLNGTDGTLPCAGVTVDAAGNVFGTTYAGGSYGYGTVFELTAGVDGSWTEKVLLDFNYTGSGGYRPTAALIFDADGNLYGTTTEGGSFGHGVAFELKATNGVWTETVLHSFSTQDGISPYAALIFDTVGNLYGTTVEGGFYGYGTVFKLTPSAHGVWTERVLHSFNNNGTDGTYVYAGVIFDAAGNLFGATQDGGIYNRGTVFELTPAADGNWQETILYHFQENGTDGYQPMASLAFGADGGLYGTTSGGGKHDAGTVFKLVSTSGRYTEYILHSFASQPSDGSGAYSGVILDGAGKLFGATYYGGAAGYGAAFELTPTPAGGGIEEILCSFGGANGRYANGLSFDTSGDLFGTTMEGGVYGSGTVFEITP